MYGKDVNGVCLLGELVSRLEQSDHMYLNTLDQRSESICAKFQKFRYGELDSLPCEFVVVHAPVGLDCKFIIYSKRYGLHVAFNYGSSDCFPKLSTTSDNLAQA